MCIRDRVCAIVKLKTKINGHKATIAEDYQDLKEIVMDKRREEAVSYTHLDVYKRQEEDRPTVEHPCRRLYGIAENSDGRQE